MPRSMTAYARSEVKIEPFTIVIEVHSVNKKGLDVRVHLPTQWLFLDQEIRKCVETYRCRGQISVRITCMESSYSSHLSVLKETDQQLRFIAQSIGFAEERPYSLEFLLAQREKHVAVIPEQARDNLTQTLLPHVQNVLAIWQEMRKKEGQFLGKDLMQRFDGIAKIREHILQEHDQGASRLQERLEKAFLELEEKLSDEDRRRILKEVVLYAEKTDISEELTRLASHIVQANQLFEEKESIGKTLDFLLQEMLRESSTMCAKISDATLVYEAIKIRRELENIREQAQNIE